MSRRRLSREDWIAAAVGALGEKGVAGVAVEPLAKALGATKGSFYWHFTDRDALLAAALDAWKHDQTDEVISFLEQLPSPRERLEMLVHTLFTRQDSPDLAFVLGWDSGHPLVRDALSLVARRRITYVEELFRACGLPENEASARAVVAYSAYLGYCQLVTLGPEVAESGSQAARYAETLLTGLGQGV